LSKRRHRNFSPPSHEPSFGLPFRLNQPLSTNDATMSLYSPIEVSQQRQRQQRFLSIRRDFGGWLDDLTPTEGNDDARREDCPNSDSLPTLTMMLVINAIRPRIRTIPTQLLPVKPTMLVVNVKKKNPLSLRG
jgi:hypothetical protein